MKKIDEDYAAFAHLMNEKKIFLKEGILFEGICALIGADATALNRLIQEELGCSGQSLVDLYRSQEE